MAQESQREDRGQVSGSPSNGSERGGPDAVSDAADIAQVSEPFFSFRWARERLALAFCRTRTKFVLCLESSACYPSPQRGQAGSGLFNVGSQVTLPMRASLHSMPLLFPPRPPLALHCFHSGPAFNRLMSVDSESSPQCAVCTPHQAPRVRNRLFVPRVSRTTRTGDGDVCQRARVAFWARLLLFPIDGVMD